MKINMPDWKAAIIGSEKRGAMPLMTYPGISLTGSSVRDVVTDSDAQFRTVMALADCFPQCLAVPMIMDLSVEAEAFGCGVTFSDDEIPTVKVPVLTTLDDVTALTIPETGAGRTAIYLTAAGHLSDSDLGRPLFGGVIGPYSLAGRLYNITEMMTSILIEPDGAHALLEKCTAFIIGYIRAFREKGCNGVVIAEPAAGLLAPDQCDEFSSRYVREIVDSVQDDNFMVMLHNCGYTESLVETMSDTGAAALHFGNAVDMRVILPRVPSERLVMGNIDPAGILKNSTPDEVYRNTSELLAMTSEYDNFVLSSGCDVPPSTPLENIRSFFRALEEYNNKII